MNAEIKAILDRIEQMEADNAKKYDELKSSFDTIMNSYRDSEDKFNRNEFATRNGEVLGKYGDTLKKLQGDDFDIMKEAYDEYHNGSYDDMEEAEYIAKLTAIIEEKLKAMKEALGSDHVMAESEGDETKIETHDEVAEAKGPEEEPKPETVAEVKVEEEHTSDEVAKTTPTEATGRVSKERRDDLGDWGKKPRKTSDEDAKEAPDENTEEIDEKAEFEKSLEDYAKQNPEFNRIARK